MSASIHNRGNVCSHLILCPLIYVQLTALSAFSWNNKARVTKCFCVCVCLCLCVCAHLRCLLHLQGLDGAKGDKVSLPFCWDEGIWRAFEYKGVEQMGITRDGSSPPPPHAHTRADTQASTCRRALIEKLQRWRVYRCCQTNGVSGALRERGC